MKIVSIVGARPQFIKAAVVSRALKATPGIEEVLVHTGQHYDDNMSRVFFQELELPEPGYDLAIGSGPHGEQTGRMLEAIERVLQTESPDWVLVYGDTNSTLAGALAAVKLHIPVAHVEAGLRSFDRRMPEEINRVLTDHASGMLFAPTATAVANLRREGLADARIRLVGDVMYDAVLYYGKGIEGTSTILKELGLKPKSYVLATVHRADNTDDPDRLRAIFDGLGKVAAQIPVVLPLHPRTRVALKRYALLDQAPRGLHVIDPVGYLDMLRLESNAKLIATDSGGVQKEAFFCRVPCVTFRNETEWTELVDAGWNRLAPPTSSEAVAAALLGVTGAPGTAPADLFGGGHASDGIVQALVEGADARMAPADR
ncbi:MAG: UDP-N-acetylglucosamine 2-epimerase (non-hydrolyzing) [Chloroflexi bacterium]|nr:UDP-N-acetylglucosamine 2-epimerase (non-hydrolyzing) [Chloroflexota bacterium]